LPFTPETVELPDVWAPCPRATCGSTVAFARVDTALGPVVVTCENGHFRRFGSRVDAEPRLEPGPRRRSEVLEDADRCALCGTPPAEHPYGGEELRGDREIWAWLQRWRPEVFAAAAQALAPVRASGTVGWRLAIAPEVREAVVDALRSSDLTTDHVVPLDALLPVVDVLSKRELGFAVNHLLIAICRSCAARRANAALDRHALVRAYVDAVFAGDERLARADAPRWRAMAKLAAVVTAAAERSGTLSA
jgi:hypothetical protein